MKQAVILSATAYLTLLLFATPTVAQDDSEVKGGLIEEITVTATRRELDLMDTPVAVSAFSQASLDKNQVKDVQDLVDIVPSLQISRHGDSNALDVTLRGVGSVNRTELGDPAVAFHVNDIYSPRPQGAAVLMYDVERVEVLRGPQGTLYGRNATVGSINIHTKKPVIGEFQGDASFSVGNFDRVGVKGAINIPLAENAALRIAAYSDRHDAYVDVLPNYIGFVPGLTMDNIGEFNVSPQVGIDGYEQEDQTSYRASLLWDISDRLTWYGVYEIYHDNGTGAVDLDPTLVDQGTRGVVVDSPGFVDMDNWTFSSRIDAELDKVRLSYLLGVANQKRVQIWDADLGRGGDIFQEDRTESSDYDFISHEFQIASNTDGPFEWLVGLYSSMEDNTIRFDIDQVTNDASAGAWAAGGWSWIDGVDGGGASFRQPSRELESRAIFAQATFSLSDRMRLTAGARYIDDEKSDVGGRSINCGPFIRAPRVQDSLNGIVPANDELFQDANILAGATDNGSNAGIGAEPCWVRQVNDSNASWDKTTGLLRYEVDFSTDSLIYASVGTGFKSGIIQDAGLEAAPEEITNMELGYKSTLLDGRLRLTTSLYRMDYQDLQVSRPQLIDLDGDNQPDTQGSLFTENAAEATINGFEVEADLQIGENGLLTTISSLLDAEYDEFDTNDGVFGQSNPWNPASQGALGDLGFVSLAGNSLIRAPDYEVTIAYEHSLDTSFGTFTPRVKMNFVDDVFLSSFNRTVLTDANGMIVNDNIDRQPAYQMYDVSLRYEPLDSSWSAEMFVNNLTDRDVRTAIGQFLTPAGTSSYYKAPRTSGVTFSFYFD